MLAMVAVEEEVDDSEQEEEKPSWDDFLKGFIDWPREGRLTDALNGIDW
jgi:hypothetical protein